MRREPLARLICFLLGCTTLWSGAPGRLPPGRAFGDLPLRFEPNVGQTDGAVQFLARGAGYALFVTPTGVTLRSGTVLRMQLVGSNPAATAEAREPHPARSHYLTGGRWHTGVPAFGRILYRDVYPGIHLAYYGNQGRLEYDFTVAPGADPAAIRVSFPRSEQVSITPAGDLVLTTPEGEMRQEQLRLYQESAGGVVEVTGKYVLTGPGQVGFEVGAYNHATPLVIDPVLSYATYLGGGSDDAITSMALDAAGNIYVAGWTSSTDFPVANAKQPVTGGGVDAFVAKLNPAGRTLLYATYLGGRMEDRALGLAVDPAGEAVITGYTYSTTFPTASAVQATPGGGRDAFVTKLNAAGNGLIFSTYLGGSGQDSGNGIALDAQGNIYVTGDTASTNFPTRNPFRAANQGQQDVFLAKLSPTGALLYSTYLGGSTDDHASAIAVDSSGSVYLTGGTDSLNFPVLGAAQPVNGGGQDAFVAKINAAGSGLVYSTFLGGRGGTIGHPETGNAIAVDSAGNAYIAGTTSSANFPLANAYQAQISGALDAFVAKLNAAGSALVYSTYLGGIGADYGTAIAVDAAGSAYVAGYTTSTDFPVSSAIQTNNAGLYNAYVVTLAPAGNAITFGTYVGGERSDTANTIAVDATGSIYIAGQTLSYRFPTMAPLQVTNLGGYGGFIAKIQPANCTYSLGSGAAVTMKSAGAGGTFNLVTQPGCPWAALGSAPWIVLPSPSGFGTGTVSYQVNAYTDGGVPRTGTITVAGQTMTITQTASLTNSEAFVRQLYLDFLGRQADSGLATWVDGLNTGQYTRAQVANSFFTNPDFYTNAKFLSKAYIGILRRDPDGSGWWDWWGAMHAGMTPAAVMPFFLSADEYVMIYGSLQSNTDFVTALYRNILGRDPDATGLNDWVGALTSGAWTRAQLALSFVQCDEFDASTQNRINTDLMYMGFFRRAPLATEISTWTTYLASNPLTSAISQFITNTEYLGRF
jgi:uncharacterized protein DUF4214/beta-propeller repeat-containing protein